MEEILHQNLSKVKAKPETIAYVVGLLTDKNLSEVLHVGSIVLSYHRATTFDQKRKIGDCVLASEIAFKGWLTEPELCISIAGACYDYCWRNLTPRWSLYEELSSRLPTIIDMSRRAFESQFSL